MLHSDTHHISSLELDLLEMGSIDPTRKAFLVAHLESCPACRDAREILRRARAEFTSNMLPRTVLPLKARFRETRGMPSAARLGVLAGLVACAAALLLFFRQPAGVSSLGEHETPGQGDARERVKGASELLLVARRGGRVFPVDRFNHELGAGDEIRAVVTQSDPTRPWLLVASIDGSAKTNVYFPFRGQKSGHLEHVGRWEVPGSIVLDDSPGPERIFAFFSKEPLDAALVAKSLEALGREGWPAVRAKSEIALEGVVQSSVLLEKPVHDLER